MKRFFALLLAVLMVLSLTACVANNNAAQTTDTQTEALSPEAAAEEAAAKTKDTTSLSDIIRVPFGYLLDWLYVFSSNYGVALILFSLVVKVVLLPLLDKSISCANAWKGSTAAIWTAAKTTAAVLFMELRMPVFLLFLQDDDRSQDEQRSHGRDAPDNRVRIPRLGAVPAAVGSRRARRHARVGIGSGRLRAGRRSAGDRGTACLLCIGTCGRDGGGGAGGCIRSIRDFTAVQHPLIEQAVLSADFQHILLQIRLRQHRLKGKRLFRSQLIFVGIHDIGGARFIQVRPFFQE